MEVPSIGFSYRTQPQNKNGLYSQKQKKFLWKKSPFPKENEDYEEKQKE